MNENTSTTPRIAATARLIACAAVMMLLGGCHKGLSNEGGATAAVADEAPTAEASQSTAKNKQGEDNSDNGRDKAGGEGVALKPEETRAMGIATTAATSIQSAPEVQGFGIVVAHETVAAALAEVRTTAAAEHQSQLALVRSQRLAGTPGAVPAEAQETAERQSATDKAALELAQQKLSSTFGQNPPWKSSEANPDLLELASGRSKLVHVTFPLGSLGDTDPTKLRLARIDASQGGKSWQSGSVWRAPADATIPGRSYFAILKEPDASEGDHLLAWAPVGEPETGVLVPSSAAVISGGKFYCYVEEKPDTFVRTEFDPGRPTAAGYFVKKGVSAGDRIVTHAAGQLLARDLNPAKEAE